MRLTAHSCAAARWPLLRLRIVLEQRQRAELGRGFLDGLQVTAAPPAATATRVKRLPGALQHRRPRSPWQHICLSLPEIRQRLVLHLPPAAVFFDDN